MGTFARIVGKPTIPKSKKKELNKRLYSVLWNGGMCSFKDVSMFDTKILLLTPPQKDNENIVSVRYNYFEDAGWEDAGYDKDTCDVWSGKIGSGAFNRAIFAAYMLEELYSTTPCYAEADLRSFDLGSCVGWLNHLFQENFSLQNRNYWNIYMARRIDKWTDKDITFKDVYEEAVPFKDNEIESNNMLAVLAAMIEELYTNSFTQRRTENEHSQTVYDFYHAVKSFKESCKADDNEQIDELLNTMYGNYKPGFLISEEIADILIPCMKKLVPQEVIRIMSKIYEKDFWEIWKLINADNTICLPYIGIASPQPPVPTQDYFPYETRYYLYNWTEDSGIPIGVLDDWFTDLKNRYNTILKNDKNSLNGFENGLSMLRSLITTLKSANKHYKGIYAFHDMFYEFVEHGTDHRYQALWQIFCDLVLENWDIEKINEEKTSYWTYKMSFIPEREKPARAEIKGYLGLLANKKLRKKIFGV